MKVNSEYAVEVIKDFFEILDSNGVKIDGGIHNKACLVVVLDAFVTQVAGNSGIYLKNPYSKKVVSKENTNNPNFFQNKEDKKNKCVSVRVP